MAILLNDNLDVAANKPTDIRYGPYATVQAANDAIPSFKRYIGLTVGIGTSNVVDYWYKAGTTNTDLVEKTSGATGGVTSVNGETGVVTIDKADVGLGNVDNTSDANKPVSTAQQTALNAKENTITAGTTTQYWRGDKSWQTLNKSAVGLSNVDNTSDANKPVSTAQQTALNAKQDTLVSGTNIKTINGNSLLGGGDLVVGSGGVTQVNSDWNATTGVAQILNKPTEFPPSTHTHSQEQISSDFYGNDSLYQDIESIDGYINDLYGQINSLQPKLFTPAIATADTNLTSNRWIHQRVQTSTASPITITLPTNPQAGDRVVISSTGGVTSINGSVIVRRRNWTTSGTGDQFTTLATVTALNQLFIFTTQTATQGGWYLEPVQTHKHALTDLEQGGATLGQVIKWDGTKWAPGSGSINMPVDSAVWLYDPANGEEVLSLVDETVNLSSRFQEPFRVALNLGNVNNTSDLNKPVSTATQTALDTKQATLVSGTNIKTINGTSLLGSGDIALGSGGAQVNADWNATTGVAQILNKPTLGTAAARNADQDLNKLSNVEFNSIVIGNSPGGDLLTINPFGISSSSFGFNISFEERFIVFGNAERFSFPDDEIRVNQTMTFGNGVSPNTVSEETRLNLRAAPILETRTQAFVSSSTYLLQSGRNVHLDITTPANDITGIITLPRFSTDGAESGDELVISMTGFSNGQTVIIERYIWTGSSYIAQKENVITTTKPGVWRFRLLGGVWTLQPVVTHTHNLEDLSQDGATTGQVIKWNGTKWAPAADAGGSTVTDGSITNIKLADVPTATIKGRIAAGTGTPEDLTVIQARNLLGIAAGLPAPKILLRAKPETVNIYSLDVTNNEQGPNIPFRRIPYVKVQDISLEILSWQRLFLECVIFDKKPDDSRYSISVPSPWKVVTDMGSGEPVQFWSHPWPQNFMTRTGSHYGGVGNNALERLIKMDRPNHFSVTYLGQTIPMWQFLNGRFAQKGVRYIAPNLAAGNFEILPLFVPTNMKKGGGVGTGARKPYASRFAPLRIACRYVLWDPAANNGQGQFITGPLSRTVKIWYSPFPFNLDHVQSSIEGRSVATINPKHLDSPGMDVWLE